MDNTWTTFKAGGADWLVLTLELWPRPAAVDWAEQVVASHPKHNVIIQTHHYLDGNASISSSNGGYGNTSPKQLYDKIVSKYANVKLVFSGHTGTFASRTDTVNGNVVSSFLGNEVGGRTNPMRILTIDPANGTVTSTVYDQASGKSLAGFDTSGRITVIR